jgi:hypothetical protein
LGLWQKTKRVMTETGLDVPVPIDLERAPDGGYAFRLGVRAGIAGQDTARIPISVRTNPAPHPILKEIHSCEVAGRTLEAANVHALRAKAGRLLEQLAPGHKLPLCFFRAPAMDYELPVYEEHGEYVSPIIGGANLKAHDLAGIRRHVCRYLLNAGYVARAEEVTVGVLRPSDLRRVPPAAVFRSLDDSDMWLPSVEGSSPDGPVVGVMEEAVRLRRSERRRAGAGPAGTASPPAAPDVVELLRFLRTELARSGGLADPRSLYATEVRDEIWRDAERHTEDTGTRLTAYLSDAETTALEMPVRATGFGEVTTALADEGITVLLAADVSALAEVAGRYLEATGFLRFATEVEIHAAAPPRAERLDADTIWTANEPEEVPAT